MCIQSLRFIFQTPLGP